MQYAREGARVICFDISAEAAGETARLIRAEGFESIAIVGDAAKGEDVRRAIDACLSAYGRIDILHNNVGIVVNGGVVDLPEEEWDRVFNINLKSCYLAMKHAIPKMIEGGGGAIGNVSSISSIRFLGTPYASYYTSKAAMNHLTRVTAAEFARHQIRVNAILPGLMDTPMAVLSAMNNHGVEADAIAEAWQRKSERIPMGWMGDAWDLAKAAVFLASDDARFITGVSLVVDGGLTLRS